VQELWLLRGVVQRGRERERPKIHVCTFYLKEDQPTDANPIFPVHYAGLDHSGVQFATGKLMDLMTI
jgi:hypothetical protein